MSTATRKPAPATCPQDSILHAIAKGRLPEPLLGVYLEHLESCDACCVRIEREAAPVEPAAAPRLSGPERPEFDRWLTRLKRATPPATSDDDPLIGTTIGPFRIVEVLGTGGTSIVYEAIDEQLERTVVLKVLRTVPDDASEQHRLVVAEARALAAVQHDAVMPLLQLLWHEGAPVLVFPRLAGETLADAIAAGSITPHDALTVTRDVARGLAHTHALGIFHHDVKPSNIWLQRRPDGQLAARIFDFGLAGTPTVIAGTPGYADPATAAASAPEPRDLFSLGVVLHECLAHAPAAPARCGDLVRRLTATDPASRPGAAEVAAAIDRMLVPRARVWRLVVGFAALLLCVAAAAIVVAPWSDRGFAGWAPTRPGPIRPDVFLPSEGLPVGLSGDGRKRCFVTDDSVLRITPVSGLTEAASVPLQFRPDRLAFNEEGTRVAAADAAGNVAIVDVASAAVSMTHQFADGVAWLGWAGWNRDAVVVLSGHTVHAFFKTPQSAAELDDVPEWVLRPLREDVRAIATLPGTEAVLSIDATGHPTMWSVGGLTDDVSLLSSTIKLSRASASGIIGWKSRGECFFAEGRRVTEVAVHHNLERHTLPAPAKAIVWVGESLFVMLTDEPGTTPRLLLADRSRPDWTRYFDVGGSTIEAIQLLADRRRIAAIASDGGVRIYRLPERP